MHTLDLLCFDEPFRFDLRSMRAFAMEPGAISLVVEIEATMVGFAVVSVQRRRAGVAAYVNTIDVHPDYRRLGLARMLLTESERRAARGGATEISLHVHTGNVQAVRFYEACGYVRLGRVDQYYGRGVDAWVYARTLVPSGHTQDLR